MIGRTSGEMSVEMIGVRIGGVGREGRRQAVVGGCAVLI